MKWYQLNQKKLEETLQVKADVGLGEKQVAKRRQQYGENVLAAKKKNTRMDFIPKTIPGFYGINFISCNVNCWIIRRVY